MTIQDIETWLFQLVYNITQSYINLPSSILMHNFYFDLSKIILNILLLISIFWIWDIWLSETMNEETLFYFTQET